MLQNIDNVLWSYSTKHFIAHATLNVIQRISQSI
jgi:DNA polymerase IIIc chi subunit